MSTAQSRLSDGIGRTMPFVRKIPPSGLGFAEASDFSLLHQATRVTVENKEEFSSFCRLIKEIPEFSILAEDCVAASNAGGFVGPVTIEQVAHFILAQALLTKDPEKVATDVIDFFVSNHSKMEMVLSLRGLSVPKRLSLGPNISLVPLLDLAPSVARGAALGQDFPFPRYSQEFRASSALVTTIDVKPVIVRSTEGRKFALDATRVGQLRAAQNLLSEACNCFVLFMGWAPAEHVSWSHLAHPGARFLMQAGWGHSGAAQIILADRPIDDASAQTFFRQYYTIPEGVREKALRVPIDRLARATRALGATDRAIELGVALEALLLHDNGGGELSYRLSLRGAQLHGGDLDERQNVRKLLKKVYDLRSKAVHSGWVDPEKITDGATAGQTLESGANECAKLIRLVISREGEIDFNALELGA